jgi:hypothetical protein
MPVEKGELFRMRDIFVGYPFEAVMFRWSHQNELIFRKFYGAEEDREPISHDNGLFNEALLGGDEITYEQYETGK